MPFSVQPTLASSLKPYRHQACLFMLAKAIGLAKEATMRQFAELIFYSSHYLSPRLLLCAYM